MLRITNRRFLTLATIAVLGAAFPLAACSDDDNDGIGLEVGPATLTLAPGGTGTTTATITREGNFNEAVLLARTGGPELILTTFSPAAIPNPETQSTITVTVGGAVPAGTYELTISAAGEDVNTVNRTLTVVVTTPG